MEKGDGKLPIALVVSLPAPNGVRICQVARSALLPLLIEFA